VIVGTVLVGAPHGLGGFLFRHVGALHNGFDAVLKRRLDIDADHIGKIAQNIICGLAHHDVGFGLCQHPQYFHLVIEQVHIGNELVVFRCENVAVMLPVGHLHQKAAVELFIRQGKQFFADAAFNGCQLQKLLVHELYVQVAGDFQADLLPAAAKAPGDGNNKILHVTLSSIFVEGGTSLALLGYA
jgi:hypothetical protein